MPTLFPPNNIPIVFFFSKTPQLEEITQRVELAEHFICILLITFF